MRSAELMTARTHTADVNKRSRHMPHVYVHRGGGGGGDTSALRRAGVPHLSGSLPNETQLAPLDESCPRLHPRSIYLSIYLLSLL